MAEALREAKKAEQQGEVPIGAVVVCEGKVVGRGYNRVESLQDATAHAEIIAITSASNYLKSWRLQGATIYSTVEPCPMCAGAIFLSRMERLVFGAPDPRYGACGSALDVINNRRLDHKVEVASGVLEEECARLLDDFFEKARGKIQEARGTKQDGRNKNQDSE